jgi:hypothetical protein
VIRGTAEANGHRLGAGDAMATDDSGPWKIEAVEAVEALLFDMG